MAESDDTGSRARSRATTTLATVPLVILVVLGLGAAIWWFGGQRDAKDTDESSAPAEATEPPSDDVREAPRLGQQNAAAATAAPAPVAGPFPITGRVVTPNGDGAAEARVAIIGADGTEVTVTTDLDGGFATGELGLGLYTVSAAAPGFAPGMLVDVVPGGPAVTVALRSGSRLDVDVFGTAPEGARCHLGGAGLFPASRVPLIDGRCTFDAIPDGRYQLFAAGPGVGSRVVEVRSPRPGPARLDLGPAQTLTVSVVGVDGGPLSDALVTVATEPMHVLAVHGITGVDGKVEFPGLRRGAWWVSVRVSGYLPTGAKRVAHPSEEIATVRPARGVVVSGYVRDSTGTGVPLAKIVARVETEDGARWLVERDNLALLNHLARPSGSTIGRGSTSFTSGARGRFEIGGLPAGEIAVEARKDGWTPAGRVVVEATPGERVTDVELVLERGGRFEGRIVGPGGAGIELARVRWRIVGDDVWGWREEGRVGDGGRFVLEGTPQRFEIEASATGYATGRTVVEGRESVVELQPLSGTIVGRVIGPEGPLYGASVRLVSTGVDPLACLGESGRDGRFELQGCGVGGRVLEVVGPSIAPLYVFGAPGDELDIDAGRGGRLLGRAVGVDGQGLEEATLSLESSVPVAGSDRRQPFAQQHSFGSGGFGLEYVPPGDVTLTVSAPGRQSATLTRVVEEGEEIDLGDVELVALGGVSGFVLDQVGAPVANAWVSVGGEATTTDEDGRFEFGSVAIGRAEVEARHWLIGRGTGGVAVEEGSAPRVDVRLDDPLSGDADWVALLRAEGVLVEPDERGWIVSVVASDSLWHDVGLDRGDHIESVTRSGNRLDSVTVVRDGRRTRLSQRGE